MLTQHVINIGSKRCSVTARGTDSYAYIAADQVEHLDAIFGLEWVNSRITDSLGNRWRVVDTFPGMDALLERI